MQMLLPDTPSTTAESNEFNNIVRQYFGEWSLRNKVRLQNTHTVPTDGFTWNYNNSALKLDGSRVLVIGEAFTSGFMTQIPSHYTVEDAGC